MKTLFFVLMLNAWPALAAKFECSNPAPPPIPRTPARQCDPSVPSTLFTAAERNCVNLVQNYARRGDDLNPMQDFYQKRMVTPLALAVEKGSIESARILLEGGATPEIAPCRYTDDPKYCEKKSLLTVAAAHGDPEMIRLLMRFTEKRFDNEAYEAGKENGTVVETLLGRTTELPRYALRELALKGYCASIVSILDTGFKDPTQNETMEAASLRKDYGLIEQLLERGYSMASGKCRESHQESGGRDETYHLLHFQTRTALENLESLGVDLRARDCMGRTILNFARSLEVAEKGLALGLSPADKDVQGWNALAQLAAEGNDSSPVDQALWKLYREKGARTDGWGAAYSFWHLQGFLNERDAPYSCSVTHKDRTIPLVFLAIAGNNEKWTSELLAEGQPLNDRYLDCTQPLEVVWQQRRYAFGEKLLKAGAKALVHYFHDPIEEMVNWKAQSVAENLRLVQLFLSRGYPKTPVKERRGWSLIEAVSWCTDRENAEPLALAMLQAGFNPRLTMNYDNGFIVDCVGNHMYRLEGGKCPKLAAVLRPMKLKTCH